MTLLPFTIDKWRSGLKVCTANRIDVVAFRTFEFEGTLYGFTGLVRGALQQWGPEAIHPEQALLDLRLRPKTEKRLVLIWRTPEGKEYVSFASDIGMAIPSCWQGIARVEIEVPV